MGFLKKKPKNIINFLFLYEIYLYLGVVSNQVAESCKKGERIMGVRFENSAIFLYKDTCIIFQSKNSASHNNPIPKTLSNGMM